MGSSQQGGGSGRAQRACGCLGTLAASDAGAQAAGGQHNGRDGLTTGRLINEDNEARVERHPIKDLNNTIRIRPTSHQAGDTPHAGIQIVSDGAANSGGEQGHGHDQKGTAGLR
jgi:hypothetical protein